MTISPLGSAPSALYLPKTRDHQRSAGHPPEDDAVRVELSSAARLSMKLDERVEEHGRPLLDALPDHGFDVHDMMKDADTAVKSLMRTLGIPSNTSVNAAVDTNGTIQATLDHPGAAYFSASLNTDEDTRNALVGAANAIKLQAHAQVVQQARTTAQSNPSNADSVYGQALTMVDDMKGWGVEFAFSRDQPHAAHIKSDGTLLEAL